MTSGDAGIIVHARHSGIDEHGMAATPEGVRRLQSNADRPMVALPEARNTRRLKRKSMTVIRRLAILGMAIALLSTPPLAAAQLTTGSISRDCQPARA
jgi:hypothetical protein